MIKKDSNQKQLAIDLIKKTENFLIITHARPDGDAISASLAFKNILEKMGKKADIIIPDKLPLGFEFLPGYSDILRDVKINRDLVISIKSSAKGKVGKISYNKREDGTVDLVVSPAEGEIRQEDLECSFGKFNYGALIVLDTPDFGRASSVYEENKSLFSNIPIINIDHHSTNGSFGDVNIVDESATSTSEILFSLIESLDKGLFDENVATLLLAGILTDTNRFQNTNTTPKSLTISAQLIASGAKRDEIVKNVFKTHPIATLKLWGRVLSNIKEDVEDKIVWSAISRQEIGETGAQETETEGAMNDLLSTAPDANIVLMLVERSPGLITASLRTKSESIELDKIALSFGGGGHKKAAGFKIENVSLEEAEKYVVAKIKGYLRGERDINGKQNKVIIDDNKKKGEIVFPEKADQKNIDADFYAPTLSDIDSDQPSIIDDRSSILEKILNDKKKKEIDSLDFSKMESEFKKQKNGVDSEREYDEDYE